MIMIDLIIGLILFGFLGLMIYVFKIRNTVSYCDMHGCQCCCDTSYEVDETEVPTQYENEPTTSGEAVYEYSTSTNEKV